MGNPASKNSIHKNNSLNHPHNATVNFVNSSGEIDSKNDIKTNLKDSDVIAKFTWNYGGNQILLTGSFYKWKQTVPLQKQGDQFSILIQLPRGLHQYKFIVDGQWRFSPEDPSIPDANGNINNYIDTTGFTPMINDQKNKAETQNKQDLTDKENNFQGIQEFAKNAPKLPPHYQFCSYLKSYKHNPSLSFPGQNESSMIDQNENKNFQEQLSQADIMQLFNSRHCLPPPYHVQVDHLIRQVGKPYNSYCITQRFKNKYTTYRYFMMQNKA